MAAVEKYAVMVHGGPNGHQDNRCIVNGHGWLGTLHEPVGEGETGA